MISKAKKLIESLSNLPRHLSARVSSERNYELKLNKPVVSFTFDDFPVTAVTTGASILDEYNVKGTFYTSFGLCGKESSVGEIASINDISKLVENGHELGCHTFSHIDAWVKSPSVFKDSIEENRAFLNKHFPTLEFDSFAYPKGSATGSTKKIIEEQFATGRGIYSGHNSSVIDLNLLNACELYCVSKSFHWYDRFISLIDNCIKDKGWIIFLTHDISSNPGSFGCATEVLRSLIDYCLNKGMDIKAVNEVLPGNSNLIKSKTDSIAGA